MQYFLHGFSKKQFGGEKSTRVSSISSVASQVRKHAVGAAVSALAAGAAGAQAQEQETDSLMLEEVLVTATRRGELSLQDVPISITAFTDEQIRMQGFRTLDDYFGQIPSLTFGRVEPGGTTVIMRGCAISGFAFGDNPTTGVYLDDQPITAAGFQPRPPPGGYRAG